MNSKSRFLFPNSPSNTASDDAPTDPAKIISRRNFFGAASLVGAGLALGSSPAGAASAEGGSNGSLAGKAGAPVAIPSTIAMGSGAPLGGIGTGFLEIRPDGCFHEWQILNRSPWGAPGRRGQGTPPGTPPNLRFLLWTGKPGGGANKLRRLYQRSDENNLYSLGYVQDVEAIDYDAWYPMTTLRYRDTLLPVRVSATAFSPFMPGKTRESATPGFHYVFTLENTSRDTVQVSLLSVLDNPIVSALDDRKLNNTLERQGATTSLLLQSNAQPEDKSDLGSMCLSVTGGDHSWISGTFRQFALPGTFGWETKRVESMRLDLLQDYFKTGRLPNTESATDPASDFTLSEAEIDALSGDQLKSWIAKLRGDGLFHRVIADFQAGDPIGSDDSLKTVLKEIRRNANTSLRSTWGTGALASAVTLAPGQKIEVRFTLGWFFPNHASGGSFIGHQYANWFQNAGEVNQFLNANYPAHRETTERFARCLLDTSLGAPMSFVWSSQLGTLVKNTWWSKDGHFAVWEGLGCCGLSTTDVDFDGSWSNVALFPELKLGQMKDIIRFQNDLGQVPHNYNNTFERVDRSFRRVDMNPQFVMMACRDYLWTGDKSYLEDLYPHLVRAMDYTASLDTNDDGLPDKDTSLQTYDQWGMSGAPSYIASLWIGSLRAAIRMARDLGKTSDATRWQAILDKASASFDKVLFNGEYYSLWVNGTVRDEVCMTDQISGEWFSHLMGLSTTISEKNLASAVAAILKNNYSPEIGVGNASAPKGGRDVAAVTNFQAGGVWSGIEFAFASFLMDHGWYAEGGRIVEAVYRRYLRAGMPWTHVECGSHYTRAMSSWATLLAATGFKPDWPARMLILTPSAPGNFRAPWVTASGFGIIARKGRALSLTCQFGEMTFQKLRVNVASAKPAVRVAGRAVKAAMSKDGGLTTFVFDIPVSIAAGETCTIA